VELTTRSSSLKNIQDGMNPAMVYEKRSSETTPMGVPPRTGIKEQRKIVQRKLLEPIPDSMLTLELPPGHR
jgi:hypothetical protein